MVEMDLFAKSSAVISPCGRYRYRLERDGPGEGRTVVIMVNPSTADATEDDATIRKLKGFGARNQWGRIIVGNLFAYRATDVRELATADDPVGPENDDRLRAMMMRCERLIFAWGRNTKVPANPARPMADGASANAALAAASLHRNWQGRPPMPPADARL